MIYVNQRQNIAGFYRSIVDLYVGDYRSGIAQGILSAGALRPQIRQVRRLATAGAGLLPE